MNMENLSFKTAVDRIVEKDRRYPAEAYFFVRDGLDYTVKHLKRNPRGPTRHVTGKELAKGLCDYAREEYGPMASFTLKTWRIMSVEDFGAIVFNLVAAGKLGKTKEDKQEDFTKLFDLHAELTSPYEIPVPPPVRRRT